MSDAPETVRDPGWYTSGAVETIAKIEAVIDGLPAREAFLLGQVIRYADRAEEKDDPAIDLGKANNYAHRLVFKHWRLHGLRRRATERAGAICDSVSGALGRARARALRALLGDRRATREVEEQEMSEITNGYEVVASADVMVSKVTRASAYADAPYIILDATLNVDGDDASGRFSLGKNLPDLSITEPLTLILVRRAPASDGA